MDPAPASSDTAFRVEQTGQAIVITGQGYSLRIARQQPEMDLFMGTRLVATLDLASSLDTMEAFDDNTVLGSPVLQPAEPGQVVIVWQGRSRLWTGKEVTLRAWQDGFSYHYSVYGQGAIDRAYFWRNQAQGSTGHSVRLFNPEPNSRSVHYSGQRCWAVSDCDICYPAAGSTVPPDFMTISVGRDKTYHGGNWFFTPAPFCYCLAGQDNWLALGIAAQPGEWNFSDYSYPGAGFGFSLGYDGHSRVAGRWQSPDLWCLVAPDEYAAIERYGAALRAAGLAPDHGRTVPHDWWREPIFCGWGEQVSQAVQQGGLTAPDRATQAYYQVWMELLDERQINPGTVVIDDKWQLNYGLNEVDRSKWPDLAGFIARQHLQGRKVLLWLKAWDPQGLPPEECITGLDGLPVAVDPGHPRLRERIFSQVHQMLHCLDADGFKVDFTHLIPRGPSLDHLQVLRNHEADRKPVVGLLARPPVSGSVGGKWGLELMRQWLLLLSEAARAAKPDAVIITHTANPYLADLVDILRLNDVAGLQDIHGSISPDMQHRARIARAASPYWLLDADNWPCSSLTQWRNYVLAQSSGEYGIPALYHIKRFGWGAVNQALMEEDFSAVRTSWKTYRATLPHDKASPRPST